MNIHEERIRVARMVAQCREVQVNPSAPEEDRCAALLWCSAIGEYVIGNGPDEWAAVQAAHALRDLARGR